MAVAARSCCNTGVKQNYRAEYNYDFEYHGERVIHDTNLNQCLADNGTVCDPVAMKADNPLVNIRPVYNYPFPSQNTFFWTEGKAFPSWLLDNIASFFCSRTHICKTADIYNDQLTVPSL